MRIPEWFTGGSIGRRNDREKVRQTFARLGVHVSSFSHASPALFAQNRSTFSAVVVVWARFAVERRAALRKLILPAISSCLHWFGLSENPEELFLSLARSMPAFEASPAKIQPFLYAPIPTFSSSFLFEHVDYWKNYRQKFSQFQTRFRSTCLCLVLFLLVVVDVLAWRTVA